MSNKEIGFGQLAQNLPIGVFRCSTRKNARILFANSAMCTLLGITPSEALKKSVDSIFEKENRFEMFRKKVLMTGRLMNFEIRLKGKRGNIFWAAMSASIVEDKKKKTKYIDAVVKDISDRKRAEKELIESRELFRTVFNNTAAAITVTDKNQHVVAWNAFAEKMLGMSKMELFNRPVKDFYPEEEWEKITGLNVVKKGVVSDVITKACCQDGRIIDVNLSLSVLKDADGEIVGTIGILNDITEQKEAERKIRESESKIRVILDNSEAAIMLTDEQERIVSWNKFTEKLLSMKQKDLQMRPVSSLYPPAEWHKIRKEGIKEMGARHHLETKVITKTGKEIDVAVSINVLRDADGTLIGAVGIMHDITEQKKIQAMLLQAKLAAEEANSAKSMFLANMSHEVRTPMNAIIGMIDLTLDTTLQQEQRDNLVVAKEAADNLLGLINDILDLSRVEAGKITLEKIDVNIPNVIKSVCKGLSVLAQSKNLNLVMNVGENVPDIILGDPVRIRQVLINLINNAIKFTEEGQIELELAVEEVFTEKREVRLRFSVKDQGIGIPKERQASVFEVFEQAETSTTRRFGGSGLGLAISKRLVEMMEGRIWVESEVGVGSTFFFTGLFKVVQQKADAVDASLAAARKAPGASEKLKGLKILLAEDNLVNQKIAVRMLEKQEWKVDAVDNGEDVVEFFMKKDYDLILMDAQMPKMDGLEATKAIRQIEKEQGGHIPIIALTARAMHEDRKNCTDAGMDGYVAKPIDRVKMFEEIEQVVLTIKDKGKK